MVKTREEVAAIVCEHEGLPLESLIVMQKLRGHGTMHFAWHKEGKTVQRSYRPNEIARFFGYTKGAFVRGCKIEVA